MSAVSERAKSLARIAAVQAKMVELAEFKLDAARSRRDSLDADRALLSALVGGEQALGAGLARAALRSARALDARIGQAGTEIAALQGELVALRRRDHTVASMAEDARGAARREEEAKALDETMEAWLARASLP